jgi:nitrate/nitrite transport system substrate-binding protein
MRADWVDANPNSAKAITMAVQEAQMWCDRQENRAELAQIVSKRAWFNVPEADIVNRLLGRFDYGTGRVVDNSPHLMKFWRDDASYPYQSHELWFLTENVRWGKFTGKEDFKALIAKVNREDLWRAAAKDLRVPAAQIPATTSRGVEKFFDGKVFDPAKPQEYLKSLAIRRA